MYGITHEMKDPYCFCADVESQKSGASFGNLTVKAALYYLPKHDDSDVERSFFVYKSTLT
jgi:hypothetical protein